MVCLAGAVLLAPGRSSLAPAVLRRLGTCSRTCPQPGYHSGSRPPRRCSLRRWTSWPSGAVLAPPVRLIDATPCRAALAGRERSELPWPPRYCAAHSRWYCGLKLYLVTTPDGMPVAWCLASPDRQREPPPLLAHAPSPALRPGLPSSATRASPAGLRDLSPRYGMRLSPHPARGPRHAPSAGSPVIYRSTTPSRPLDLQRHAPHHRPLRPSPPAPSAHLTLHLSSYLLPLAPRLEASAVAWCHWTSRRPPCHDR